MGLVSIWWVWLVSGGVASSLAPDSCPCQERQRRASPQRSGLRRKTNRLCTRSGWSGWTLSLSRFPGLSTPRPRWCSPTWRAAMLFQPSKVFFPVLFCLVSLFFFFFLSRPSPQPPGGRWDPVRDKRQENPSLEVFNLTEITNKCQWPWFFKCCVYIIKRCVVMTSGLSKW